MTRDSDRLQEAKPEGRRLCHGCSAIQDSGCGTALAASPFVPLGSSSDSGPWLEFELAWAGVVGFNVDGVRRQPRRCVLGQPAGRMRSSGVQDMGLLRKETVFSGPKRGLGGRWLSRVKVHLFLPS